MGDRRVTWYRLNDERGGFISLYSPELKKSIMCSNCGIATGMLAVLERDDLLDDKMTLEEAIAYIKICGI